MGPIDYAYEKFTVAVELMATSSTGLRDRVLGAFLVFHTVKPEDFGEPGMTNRYREIMARLTRENDATRGSAAATLDAMSDEEIEEIASEIYALQCDVIRAYEKSNNVV